MVALCEARARGEKGGAPEIESGAQAPATAHAESLEDDVGRFWRLGPEVEALQVRVAPPEVEMEVIKVLGDLTFVEDKMLMERLTRIYRAVTHKAQEVAFDE